MNPQLWLNEYDPDLDAIGRYADPSHGACEGMGIVRECGEWAFCSCTEAALLAAAEEEPAFCQLIHRSPPHRLTASQRGEAASAASCGRVSITSAAFVLGARRGLADNTAPVGGRRRERGTQWKDSPKVTMELSFR
jgi:hypothetical protein